jgi:hypothetical protein
MDSYQFSEEFEDLPNSACGLANISGLWRWESTKHLTISVHKVGFRCGLQLGRRKFLNW